MAGNNVRTCVEDRYEHLMDVGVGVYGSVYKALDKKTNTVVAVKKLKVDQDQDPGQGIPVHVIREVSVLRDFVHPNVVQFLDIHISSIHDYSLIFEYMDRDLHSLLKQYRRAETLMPMDLIKKYARDLFNGLHACHLRLILHRDLKPQNILIGKDSLKIGDFGLARLFSLPTRVYTHDVVTLWYRAPEILLGAQKYGPEVDIWSAGCVLDEMLCGRPTFPGDSEIGTIFKIFQILGTPTEAVWPGHQNLDHWKDSFPRWPSMALERLQGSRPDLSEAGSQLVTSCLEFNPQARIIARRAKGHAFFKQEADLTVDETSTEPKPDSPCYSFRPPNRAES